MPFFRNCGNDPSPSVFFKALSATPSILPCKVRYVTCAIRIEKQSAAVLMYLLV
jgi:hypothetical protein